MSQGRSEHWPSATWAASPAPERLPSVGDGRGDRGPEAKQQLEELGLQGDGHANPCHWKGLLDLRFGFKWSKYSFGHHLEQLGNATMCM